MKHLLLAVLLALSGCAGSNINKINGPTVLIKEKILFSAEAGQTPGVKRYYHALRPGSYAAAYEDSKGTYYFGEGKPLILGARENDDGSTEEPVAEGGFWLAKDQKTVPSLELFWLAGEGGGNEVMINGVVVNSVQVQGRGLTTMQAGAAGAVGGAIAGGLLASQSFRMIRYGPRRVPLRDVPAERNALVNAMNGSAR